MTAVLLAVLALVLVNAFYVAAELSVVGVGRARIEDRCERGDARACRLLPVVTDAVALDRWVAGCQIGITLSSLILGAVGQAVIAPRVGRALEGWFELSPLAALSAAAIGVLLALTLLQMILGELVPKSLALQFPTRLALVTERPMRASLKAFAWFIGVLNGSGTLILRALGRPPSAHRHVHSPREIDWLIGESRGGGLLRKDEQRRLRRALRLEQRRVRDVMTPRSEVVTVPAGAPLDEAARLLGASAFTRLPVVEEGGLDHTVGLLHARDLALRQLADDARGQARDLARPILTVRDDEPAYVLLPRMREARCQMALVNDASGRATGIVSVSNVLDDLVGRAADEFRLVAPERVPDGRLRLPGRLRLDEAAPWVGAEWEGDAFTVAEHVLAAFGRLPRPGERVVIDEVEVEVERVGPHAIQSVLARPLARSRPDAQGAEAARG
jgi:CBS domain containing-hemolysin-like protein